MNTQQIVFLIINILGGAAVIGSYIYGINTQQNGASALWGGVPENTRTFYFVSMIVSALGYFAFLFYILFKIAPNDVSIAGAFGFGIFYLIFVLILLPSAMWMPLTNYYLDNPGGGLWFAVRVVLIIVGLSSIALAWALLSLDNREGGTVYWLAVAGAGYFAFHTAILDALIWPALFK